jgi:hypothetical protein
LRELARLIVIAVAYVIFSSSPGLRAKENCRKSTQSTNLASKRAMSFPRQILGPAWNWGNSKGEGLLKGIHRVGSTASRGRHQRLPTAAAVEDGRHKLATAAFTQQHMPTMAASRNQDIPTLNAIAHSIPAGIKAQNNSTRARNISTVARNRTEVALPERSGLRGGELRVAVLPGLVGRGLLFVGPITILVSE